MLTPPQSLHCDFRRPWIQMLLPPQSLHCDFSRPWMQMLLPPQFLHSDFRRPWVQMLTDFPPCIPIFWRFVPLKWFGSEVSSGQIEVQLRLFITNLLLPKDLVAM